MPIKITMKEGGITSSRAQWAGTGGWTDGPSSLEPMRYGHNTIRVSNLSSAEVTFGIRGEPSGTNGSPSE